MRHTPCGCAPYAELLPFAKPASNNKVLIVTVYYGVIGDCCCRGGYQPPAAEENKFVRRCQVFSLDKQGIMLYNRRAMRL